MPTQSDTSSLLLFRVGPVLCCAPSLSVSSIILPPDSMTHPPGSNSAQPGIFKHGGQIVSSLDLRFKFGVEQDQWVTPGRMIIAKLDKGSVGFWIDEIIEVIEQPKSGWGQLPPLLPRGIFSRTLLRSNEIYLYAEFAALYKIPSHGYLRTYIQQLLEKQQQHQSVTITKTAAATARPINSPVIPDSVVTKPQVQVTSPPTTPKNTQAPDNAAVSLSTSAVSEIKPKLQANTPTPARINKTPALADAKQTKANPATSAGIKQSKPITTPLKKTQPIRAKTTQNTGSHHTQEKASTNPTKKIIAAKQPTATTATTTKKTGVVTPATSSSMSPSKLQQSYEQPKESPRSAAWLLIFLLVPVLGGSGWLIWSMTASEQTSLTSIKTGNTAPATPAINPQTTTLTTSSPDSNLLYEDHNQNPIKDDPVESEISPVISTVAMTTRDTAILEDHDQNEIAVIPSDIGNEKDLHDSPETSNNATPTTDQSTSEYRATIEKEERGLVIVIDAPEEAEVFNNTDAQPNETVTLANVEQPEKTDEATPKQDQQATEIPTKKPVTRTEIVHIVVKGDTLWHIAIRYVSNPYRYPELAKLSNIKNPDLIYPGDQVRIIKRNKKSQISP